MVASAGAPPEPQPQPSSPQPPGPGPPAAAVFAGEPRGSPPPPPPPASAGPVAPAGSRPTAAPAEPGPGPPGSPGYLELKRSGSGTAVLSVSGPDRPADGLSAAAELEALDRALAAVGAGGRVEVDCHQLGSPGCLAEIGRFQAVADLWKLHGRPAVQLVGPSRVHLAILKTLDLWHGE